MFDITNLTRDCVLKIGLPDLQYTLLQIEFIVQKLNQDILLCGDYLADPRALYEEAEDVYHKIKQDDFTNNILVDPPDIFEPLVFSNGIFKLGKKQVPVKWFYDSDDLPVTYQQITYEQYKFLKDKSYHLKSYHENELLDEIPSRVSLSNAARIITQGEAQVIPKNFRNNIIVTRLEYMELWDIYQAHQQMLLVGLNHHTIWLNRRTIGEYLGTYTKPGKTFENLPHGTQIEFQTMGSTLDYYHDYDVGNLRGQMNGVDYQEELVVKEYCILYEHEETHPILHWTIIHKPDNPSNSYILSTYEITEAFWKDGYDLWEETDDGVFQINLGTFKYVYTEDCNCEIGDDTEHACPEGDPCLGNYGNTIICKKDEYEEWVQKRGYLDNLVNWFVDNCFHDQTDTSMIVYTIGNFLSYELFDP